MAYALALYGLSGSVPGRIASDSITVSVHARLTRESQELPLCGLVGLGLPEPAQPVPTVG